jgi:hypothetical protein
MTKRDLKLESALESIGFKKPKRIYKPAKNVSVDADFDEGDNYDVHVCHELEELRKL